jgi:hypothetical protein
MSKTKVKIDWKQVENLLMAGCSGVEIAASLGIHENTLYKRCKDDLKIEFVAFSQQNKAKGDSLLKAKQFESAIKDKNIPMQIWLGKNRLNQTDKNQTDLTTKGEKLELLPPQINIITDDKQRE